MALLIKRADELDGCPEGSDEEVELAALCGAIQTNETVRLAWWEGNRRQGLIHRMCAPRPNRYSEARRESTQGEYLHG
jgi:hypothetical protein